MVKLNVSFLKVHLIDTKMNLVNTFHEAAVSLFGRSKVEAEKTAVETTGTGRTRGLDRTGW